METKSSGLPPTLTDGCVSMRQHKRHVSQQPERASERAMRIAEEKHPLPANERRPDRGFLEATCASCDKIKPVPDGEFYGNDSLFICNSCGPEKFLIESGL